MDKDKMIKRKKEMINNLEEIMEFLRNLKGEYKHECKLDDLWFSHFRFNPEYDDEGKHQLIMSINCEECRAEYLSAKHFKTIQEKYKFIESFDFDEFKNTIQFVDGLKECNKNGDEKDGK